MPRPPLLAKATPASRCSSAGTSSACERSMSSRVSTVVKGSASVSGWSKRVAVTTTGDRETPRPRGIAPGQGGAASERRARTRSGVVRGARRHGNHERGQVRERPARASPQAPATWRGRWRRASRWPVSGLAERPVRPSRPGTLASTHVQWCEAHGRRRARPDPAARPVRLPLRGQRRLGSTRRVSPSCFPFDCAGVKRGTSTNGAQCTARGVVSEAAPTIFRGRRAMHGDDR